MQRFLPALLILYAGAIGAQSIIWTSTCTSKTVCLNPGSCTEGNVFATEQAVSNSCNGFMNYSYKIDLGNNGSVDIQSGADTLNGPLPLGTHLITWRANNSCGQVSTDCAYTITVKDCNPPNLLCINGLTQNLELPDCQADFHVEDFIINVNDNCTPGHLIQKGIREIGNGTGFPTDTTLSFGLCEQGLHVLQIWVKDENNLINQCNSYVLVQDNGGLCACNIDANLSLLGCAQSPDSVKLENYTVRVELTDTASLPVNPAIQKYVTDSCFDATYTGLPLNRAYSGVVRAQRIGGDPLAGVSTFDLVLINKHILGQQPLEDFYQALASDVNQSKTITTFDIIEIRKLILGVYDTFPAVPAWRFIRPVPDPSNMTAYDTVRDTYQFNIPNLLGDLTLNGFNFIGVKMGDANSNATFKGDAQDRHAAPPLLVSVPEQQLQAGELQWISWYPAEAVSLHGWQASFQFDPALLEITDLNGIPAEYVSITPGGRLSIAATWEQPRQFDPGKPLLSVLVKPRKPIAASQLWRVVPDRLAPEVYPSEGAAVRPLQFRRGDETHSTRFFPPYPNPFAGETTFHFYTEQEQTVELGIFDLSGRQVYHSESMQGAGYQTLTLPAHACPGPGVWVYRIRAGKVTESGRLVRLGND